MPRQILTIELDGLTAGDYLAYVAEPEPSARGLRSVTVRAEPLGSVVEAVLVWEAAVPDACVAAHAAGLPFVAEAVSIDARIVDELFAPEQRRAAAARRRRFAPRVADRLGALADRAASRLAAAQAAPPTPAPLLLRRW